MVGRIDESVVDEVLARSDIIEVIGSYFPLRKKGGDYWACCPFHKEKTPSFKVSASRQGFYCFGCHKSGNVFTFIMARESVEFPDAVELLGKRAGVPVHREYQTSTGKTIKIEDLRAILLKSAEHFRANFLSPKNTRAREYVERRGISPEIANKFQLGYALDSWDDLKFCLNELDIDDNLSVEAGVLATSEQSQGRGYDRFRNRVMFPIFDDRGRIVGFNGRLLGDEDEHNRKYINSPESVLFSKGRVLYGFNIAKSAIEQSGEIILMEGNFDLLAAVQSGVENCAIPLGTAFTEHHARILRRVSPDLKTILMYDSDEAGQKAVVSTGKVVLQHGLIPRVAILPRGEDPHSFWEHGGNLQEIVTKSSPFYGFLKRSLEEKLDDMTKKLEPEEKVQVFLRRFRDAVEDFPIETKIAYGRRLAQDLDLPYETTNLFLWGSPGYTFSGQDARNYFYEKDLLCFLAGVARIGNGLEYFNGLMSRLPRIFSPFGQAVYSYLLEKTGQETNPGLRIWIKEKSDLIHALQSKVPNLDMTIVNHAQNRDVLDVLLGVKPIPNIKLKDAERNIWRLSGLRLGRRLESLFDSGTCSDDLTKLVKTIERELKEV